MGKIDEQINWYENNATRKEDDLIKANLKLINNLYREIEHSEDKIFLDKIIGTFCEIMEIQRDVIYNTSLDIEDPNMYTVPNQYGFVPISKQSNSILDDKKIQEAFTTYCLSIGKSSYTANDYCSRVRNLWKSFYAEYQQGRLPKEIEIDEDIIKPDAPLFNAYHHIDVLNCYVSMNVACDKSNRNWANIRAAFNKFADFVQM